MIAFEVSVNGERLTTAGIPGAAVLNTIIGWVRHKRPMKGLNAGPQETLDINVGGLDSNGPSWEDGVHLNWVNRGLKSGDVVQVRILDLDRVDPAAHSSRRDPGKEQANRERSVRHYLRVYRRKRKTLDKMIAMHEELAAKFAELKKGKKSSRGQTSRRKRLPKG